MKRIILILAAMLVAATATRTRAEEKVWCLVTDCGDVVPTTDVHYVIAGDADDELCIVFTNGAGISGIRSFGFSKEVATGIATAGKDKAEMAVEAVRMLDFSMLPEGTPVEVFSADGKLMLRATAPRVNVGSLARGTYIIKVKETSIKLNKK